MSEKNIFVTSKGVKIEVLPVEVMKIKKARDQYRLPSRPTYTTMKPSGKTEEWPLDEVSALDNPAYGLRWQYYLEQKAEALGDQNDAIARVLFYYGTRIAKLPTDWETDHALLGFVVPDNPDLKRAHYLSTELNATDLAGLIAKIMEASGVTEDEIKDAEETFRSDLQAGSERRINVATSG